MLAISIACLFSTITSSSSSVSSGYFLMFSILRSFSSTTSFALREVEKYTRLFSSLSIWISSLFLMDLCRSCSILLLILSMCFRYWRYLAALRYSICSTNLVLNCVRNDLTLFFLKSSSIVSSFRHTVIIAFLSTIMARGIV